MHIDDRETRLQAAANLLVTLKNCGCSQRLIASYLRVSHATISRWKKGAGDPTRKAGVPDDRQLIRLVALLRYQLATNLSDALDCYRNGKLRPEGMHLWFALGSVLQDAAKDYEKEQRLRDKRDAAIRAFAKAVGLAEAKGLFRTEMADRLGDDPDPTADGWREAHARAEAEAAAELAASEVTSEDAKRAGRDLDAWRVEFTNRRGSKTRK